MPSDCGDVALWRQRLLPSRGVGGGAEKLKKVVELPIPRPRGSFVPSDWYVGARDFTPRGH